MMILLILLCLLQLYTCLGSDMYCGQHSCYEILNVSNNATSSEIRKSYHKLSLQYHPDKNPDDNEATTMFIDVSQAYSVLSDDNTRRSYDDMLSDPSKYWRHQFQYMKYKAKTRVWMVLLGLVVIITGLHYWYWQHRYYALRSMLSNHPRVIQKLKSSKNENIKLEDVVKIEGFGSRLPTLYDLLVFRMYLWPWYISEYIIYQARWFILYNLMNKQYGAKECVILTASALNMSYERWFSIEDDDIKRDLLKRQLWKEENLKQFKLEKQKEYSSSKRSRKR